MSPRPNRRPAGTYPNLLCTDALTGGRITLFRNPADKVFGEKDAYAISADWSTPDGISAAYAKAEEEERLPPEDGEAVSDTPEDGEGLSSAPPVTAASDDDDDIFIDDTPDEFDDDDDDDDDDEEDEEDDDDE